MEGRARWTRSTLNVPPARLTVQSDDTTSQKQPKRQSPDPAHRSQDPNRVYICRRRPSLLAVDILLDIPDGAAPLEEVTLCLFKMCFQRGEPQVDLVQWHSVAGPLVLSLPARPSQPASRLQRRLQRA